MCVFIKYENIILMCFSIFEDNLGRQGGIVTLLYFPVCFDGINIFSSNTGPTIRV